MVKQRKNIYPVKKCRYNMVKYMEIFYCLCCNKKNIHTKNSVNKYCNNKCQKDYEYREYIKQWLCGLVNGTRGKNLLLSRHVIRYMRENYGTACMQCGWDEKHPADNLPLTNFDHIDGDASNSRFNNLRILCPNCHSKTLTYGNRNKKSLRIRK